MATSPADLPELCADADRALAFAASRVRLLGASAPLEGESERARVMAAFASGGASSPRWTYAREDHAELARQLDALAGELEARFFGEDEPLAAIYAARAAELSLEARAASAVGTRGFGELARARFSPRDDDAARAMDLARAWIAREPPARSGPWRTTDGPEPESLASRMREALGRARVPFAVEVRADLASLAATGERTVFVAAGRAVDDEDVARTVLHEVEAHVLPRARAARLSPGIFRVGTARGADEQEGLALVLEERAGFLGARRARELAARHLAVAAMDDGASFVECVRLLAREHGVPLRDAVTVAERAYRGGDGAHAGLGRERVYLACYARVRAHLVARPADEAVLAAGQVGLDALTALRAYATP